MKKPTYTNIIITFLLILCLPFNALALGDVKAAMKTFSSKKGMERAHTGLYIIDLKTGEPVVEYCATDSFIPASVTKLVSSATTMKVQPNNFTFKTLVIANGKIKGGTLDGNLVIVGGADPTICSHHFPEHESLINKCLNVLTNAGIKRITGKVIIDNCAYKEPGVPDDWENGDMVEDYAAGLFAVNYDGNMMTIKLDCSGATPKVVSVFPRQNNLSIDLSDLTIKSGKKYRTTPRLYRTKNSNILKMSGTVRRQKNPVVVRTTIPDANDAFACLLTDTLQSFGITVNGEDISQRRKHNEILTVYKSPNIHEIVKSLLYRSDNLFAEGVFRANCSGQKKTLSRKNSIKREKSVLKDWGVDMNHVSIYDGSGLSRSNHFTPKFLGEMLLAVYNDNTMRDRFLPLIPVCGENGTVKNFLKDSHLAGKLAVKSGSMTGVQSYAGYYPIDNPQYAMVVMTNRFTCGYRAINQYLEELLSTVFEDESTDKETLTKE